MTDLATWQQNNDEYLAAALAWLHLRLEWLAKPKPRKAKSETKREPQRSRRWFFLGLADSAEKDGDEANAVVAEGSGIEKKLTQAAAAMAQAEAVQPPPGLVQLGQRFGLSRFEQELLLLCASMELDTRMAGLCARAQDDASRPYPTFALALALFDDPVWEALSPHRPLRYWQLIEINQPGAQPLTTSALRADERIVNAIKGLDYLDARLAALLVPLASGDGSEELPGSQMQAVQATRQHLAQAQAIGRPPVIQLVGPDSGSKKLVAARIGAELGINVLHLPATMFPTQAADVELLSRLWERESLMLPLALYLEAGEASETSGVKEPRASLERFLLRSNGLLFLDTRQTQVDLPRVSAVVDVTKPTPAEQRWAWQALLGEKAGGNPARLAGQFNLNLGTIHRIVQITCAQDNGHERGLDECLWEACRSRTRPQLGSLAQPLDSKARWNDIVLPGEQKSLLRQIADQVGQRITVYDTWGFRDKMNRGLGINALFAGPSGTGKTMAAEVIANELDLDLYRIDLSSVVSKYIGETEKNLRKLFDAAEGGGAILFFDEADALFGKRSEVKDSHDRYANIEISYLLQRMEAYRGLAILATNMKGALDQAFVRRLRFIVDFAFPRPADRKKIWAAIFPGGAPVEGLDYDHLARLNLTGGSIHNIALNSAFMAATLGQSVTMSLVLAAARDEFHKMERPVNEADFKWAERPLLEAGR